MAEQTEHSADKPKMQTRRVSVGGSFTRAAFGALKRAALELRD